MTRQVLDVGSGARPLEDAVCLDLYCHGNPHTMGDTELTSFFVRGDASVLPFMDNCFRVVYASHILEHMFRPVEAILEWKRVASRLVYIQVPDMKNSILENPCHLYSWSESSLYHLLDKLFPEVEIVCGKRTQISRLKQTVLKRLYEWFLSKLFSGELTALCWKKKRNRKNNEIC